MHVLGISKGTWTFFFFKARTKSVESFYANLK